jgi:hypothetical protein
MEVTIKQLLDFIDDYESWTRDESPEFATSTVEILRQSANSPATHYWHIVKTDEIGETYQWFCGLYMLIGRLSEATIGHPHLHPKAIAFNKHREEAAIIIEGVLRNWNKTGCPGNARRAISKETSKLFDYISTKTFEIEEGASAIQQGPGEKEIILHTDAETILLEVLSAGDTPLKGDIARLTGLTPPKIRRRWYDKS